MTNDCACIKYFFASLWAVTLVGPIWDPQVGKLGPPRPYFAVRRQNVAVTNDEPFDPKVCDNQQRFISFLDKYPSFQVLCYGAVNE